MAKAKGKSNTTPPRPPENWDLAPSPLPLLLTLKAQGMRDGIYLALGESKPTRESVLARIRDEGPQYLEGFLVGVEHAGKQTLREQPGDSDDERRCRYFVHRTIRRFPNGLRNMNKNDLETRCMQLFGVGGRSFERIRLACVARMGVGEKWLRAGPHGPHNRRHLRRRR
jgi:hypothetical protein